MPILSLPTLRRDLGFEGKLVYADQAYNLIIGTYNEIIFDNTASGLAKLPYGRFVQQVAIDQYDIIQAGGATAGISLATERYSNNKIQGTSFEVGYEPDLPISVVRVGAVWVVAEVDLLTTDTLFTRVTEKGTPLDYEGLGRVRNDADGADGGVAEALPTANVRLLRDTLAGCVAPIAIDYGLV